MNKTDLPQVMICCSARDYKNFLNDFIKNNYKEIKQIFKRYPSKIILINGVEIIIMSQKYFSSWRIGRTYQFYGDNKIYRSDRVLKGGAANDD